MKQPPERTRIQYTRKKRDFAIQALLVTTMGYTALVTNVSRFMGQLRKDSGTARSFKQAQASAIYAWTGEQKRPLTALQSARLTLESRRNAARMAAAGHAWPFK